MLKGNFGAEVLQTDQAADTLAVLRERAVQLVLINRKLDCDYSDGTEILKQIKADPQLSSLPVMIVTNYAEHQEAAVALGAEYGFGKLELHSPVTQQRLAKFLGPAR
jgi:CheY-like chemotaxis protein